MRYTNRLALTLLLLSNTLFASTSSDEKIKILTQYLVEKEKKDPINARNEAIATIYGKPLFKDLIYNDASEMFFGKVVSQRGDFSRNINFYMPKERAIEFQKNVAAGKIEIEHAFDDNEIVIKKIELNYKDVNYPLKVKIPNTLTLKVGGYLVAKQNTELLAQRNGVGGTLDIQDLFDMKEDTNVFRVDILYKFNSAHSIDFSYYSLKNSNKKLIPGEIEWDGYTLYDPELEAQFDTDIYKFDYIYSAYKTNKLDLSFRLGLHVTGLTTGLYGTTQSSEGEITFGKNDEIKFTAPLPVLGFGLRYEIIPSTHLNYTVDYFYLEFDGYKGSMVDSLISLEYKYNRYFGAGIGINATNTKVDTTVEDTYFRVRNEVLGGLAYIILSY
jgi:hypothetical protein